MREMRKGKREKKKRKKREKAKKKFQLGKGTQVNVAGEVISKPKKQPASFGTRGSTVLVSGDYWCQTDTSVQDR